MMVEDTIVFNGTPYFLNHSIGDGYYMSHPTGGHFGRLLHRDIYESIHGPIPHGWVVHQKDSNSLNNDPENLEAMPSRDHAIHHNNIALAREKKRLRHKVCEWCGKSFDTLSHRARYCCIKCGHDAYSEAHKEERHQHYLAYDGQGRKRNQKHDTDEERKAAIRESQKRYRENNRELCRARTRACKAAQRQRGVVE